MRLLFATLVALVALGAAVPARAATPMPWCGTSPSAADRLPDATQAFAVHVVYARTPGEPDRFAEWAPRIVGDVAAMDAWWRREDPSRTLRFDLFPAAGCSSAFGALDITSVELGQPLGGIDTAFRSLREQLAFGLRLNEREKSYLVYLDGPTGQSGNDPRVCGQGGPGGGSGLPDLAVVFLDSCTSSTSDSLRPVIALHELVHVFGAVALAAPHHCQDGHVCDAPQDLLVASLAGDELESLLLDPGRDDYYAHPGSWPDVHDSFFLEPLDSPDRVAPSAPGGLRAGGDPGGPTRLSWLRSTDDVGPVAYRVYQNGRFVRQLAATSLLLDSSGAVTTYSVRAVDGAGRLSPPTGVRFREGVGMVDASGRLVRDTVRPPAVARVAVRKGATAVTLSWPRVRDAGGVRGYRIRIGSRALIVARPAVSIARSRLRAPVSIAAVDRAGNVGPATVVPLARLR